MTTKLVRAEMLCSSLQMPRGVIFADAGPAEQILGELKTKLEKISAETEEMISAADEANRDLTDEEIEKIEDNRIEAEKLAMQIKGREAGERVRAGLGRRSDPEPKDTNGRPTIPARPRPADAGKFGFKSFGDFALTVKAAGGPGADHSAAQRLQNALTTYGNEGTGADGGFLVPPDFRREVAIKITGEDSFLARTDQQTTTTNSVVIPTDETAPWGGSGVQAYWEQEAGQKTQSKPVFGQDQVRLNKLIALIPVTDEMLSDAPLIDGYLRRKVPEVMTAKINFALLYGTGVGQPLGMLHPSNGALITVDKETSQPADTIYFANIVNMFSRMRAASLPRSVWLINQSITPQLLTMRFDPSASNPMPIYLPGGNIAGAPFGTILGRPVVPLEAMSALGDLGDIALVDPTQYLSLTKGQGIQTDISIHLFFDYDITAFRFVFRLGGQPWWKSPVTPQASGASTLSDFITLEARA